MGVDLIIRERAVYMIQRSGPYVNVATGLPPMP